MGRSASVLLLCVAIGSAAPSNDRRLIDAVKSNNRRAARPLIGQVDVNATEADGSTALHWAAQRDNVEIADLLIAAHANVKAATRYNVTPLSLACTNGNATLIEHLLKAGVDPNATSQEDQTA